jgi:hypothetical protein
MNIFPGQVRLLHADWVVNNGGMATSREKSKNLKGRLTLLGLNQSLQGNNALWSGYTWLMFPAASLVLTINDASQQCAKVPPMKWR